MRALQNNENRINQNHFHFLRGFFLLAVGSFASSIFCFSCKRNATNYGFFSMCIFVSLCVSYAMYSFFQIHRTLFYTRKLCVLFHFGIVFLACIIYIKLRTNVFVFELNRLWMYENMLVCAFESNANRVKCSWRQPNRNACQRSDNSKGLGE